MDLDRAIVLDSLARLSALDKRRTLFGSKFHNYQLFPPLDESEVGSFEDQMKIRLPADYRRFLTTIGNGGAGPHYGVMPLGDLDGEPWVVGEFVGDPAKPFPHTGPWNMGDGYFDDFPDPPKDATLEEEDALMDAWQPKEDAYWDPSNVNGAIPICDLGCAIRQWLVVNGPQAGCIWLDSRTDQKGLSPVRDGAGRPIRFASWYMNWLSEALEKARQIGK